MWKKWASIAALSWGIGWTLACGGLRETEMEEADEVEPGETQPGDTPGPITISEGENGEPVVTGENGNQWPPTGPGCDLLVRCCDEASVGHGDVSLFCRMGVVTEPDCGRQRASVAQYLREASITAPSVCTE